MKIGIKKILFIGLGGAGQRHLRIFKKIIPECELIAWRKIKKTPVLNSDFTISKKQNLKEKYKLKIYEELEEALNQKPDLFVLSLPTSLNLEFIKKAFQIKAKVFVEKPSVASLEQILEIEKLYHKNNGSFFVSFQRRFHPITLKLFNLLENNYVGKLINVYVNVASYVPDWHPYESFLNLYACKENLGGGVIRTECHEIDLILKIFGLPKKVFGKIGNYGEFKLDVEDSAFLILDYNEFVVNLNLSFMKNIQERKIEVHGIEGSITCDFINQSIKMKNRDSNEIILSFDVDNDYLFEQQLKYYLKDFNHNEEYLNDIKKMFQFTNMVPKLNLEQN